MLLLAPLTCQGCANFWDEVTDRNFEFKSLWSKPNPLVVLNDSTDGTQRAKALRALREPSQFGGTQGDQETIIKIVTTAAVSEHTAVARIAAIEALTNFRDPRATQALIAAYYASDGYRTAQGDAIKYPGDMASVIRCQSLRALGEQGNPAAVEHLVTVLRQPAARGAEVDRQMVMDERITAARALAKYNDPRAEEALLNVMRSEKDIALKDRAYESLQTATGKKLPPDPKAWEDALNMPPPQAAVAGRTQPEQVKQVGHQQNATPAQP
jgi:HEAT repeat protein